jgi:hypothetical protein
MNLFFETLFTWFGFICLLGLDSVQCSFVEGMNLRGYSVSVLFLSALA